MFIWKRGSAEAALSWSVKNQWKQSARVEIPAVQAKQSQVDAEYV